MVGVVRVEVELEECFELSELNLPRDRHVEEGVWLHDWVEWLRVLVVLVHVLVFELIRIVLIVGLFKLASIGFLQVIVNAAHPGTLSMNRFCHSNLFLNPNSNFI